MYKACEIIETYVTSLKTQQDMLYETRRAILESSVDVGVGRYGPTLLMANCLPGWQEALCNDPTLTKYHTVVWCDITTTEWKTQKVPTVVGSFDFKGKAFDPDNSMEFVHAAGFFAVTGREKIMWNYLGLPPR